jgi:hypothetical protein
MPEQESRRPSSLLWVVIAGLVSALLVGNQRRGEEGPRPTAATPSETAKAAGLAPPPHSGVTVEDFFSTGIPPRPPQPPAADPLKGYAVHYLIVTVPDPVDSRFGYAFDQLMAVIQRALEAKGYVYDRTSLPWEEDRKKLKEREPLVLDRGAGLLDRLLPPPAGRKPGEPAERERRPGELLFRGGAGGADPVHLALQAFGAQAFAPAGGAAGPVAQLLTSLALALSDPLTVGNELYVVYLVGENPTSGLSKQALTRALERIRARPAVYGSQTVKIVGPYFTGSQTSLHLTLADWQKAESDWNVKDRFKFRVVSGAADGVDRGKYFPANIPASFQATVVPGATVLRATLHYLERRERSQPTDRLTELPDQTALLIEANTGFGRAVGEGLKQSLCNCNKAPKDLPLVLPFPLHISGLKASYEKEQRARDDKAGLTVFDALIPRLGEPPVAESDLIPAQDPVTTTSLDGKLLTDLLTIIARKHIRFVGIIASDPRDKLFLASAVRDRCPGVQIFTIGSDLLLGLPEFTHYLKGTVIGSTYPLVTQNQRWTNPEEWGNPEGRRRIPFPNAPAQGYYNAILWQMDDREGMIEYRAPLVAKEERTGLDYPPIWITMVGQDGELVPLQFFTGYGDQDKGAKDYLAPGPEDGEITGRMVLTAPHTAFFSLLLVCLLAAVLLYYAFRSPEPQLFWLSPEPGSGAVEARGKAAKEKSFWAAMHYRLVAFWAATCDRLVALRKKDKELGEEKSFWTAMCYRAACLGSLAVLLVPVMRLCSIYRNNPPPQAEVPVWLIWGLPRAALLSLAPALLYPVICRYAPSPTPTPLSKSLGDGRTRFVMVLLGLVLSLVVAGVLIALCEPPWDSWHALFFYRSLAFASGASVLLPLTLTCAAFFFWAFFRLKGLWVVKHFAVKLPYPTDKRNGPHEFCRVNERAAELDRDRGAGPGKDWGGPAQFVRRHLAYAAVLLVILPAAWRLRLLYLTIPEGELWGMAFFAAFTAGAALVALMLVRSLRLWAALKKLLRAIALIRMVGAFEKLPAKITSSFVGSFFPRRLGWTYQSVALQQLGLLKEETERLLSPGAAPAWAHLGTGGLEEFWNGLTGLRDWLKKDKQLKKWLNGQRAKAGPGGDDYVGQLGDTLSEASEKVLPLLPPFWSGRAVDQAFGSRATEDRGTPAKAAGAPDADKPKAGPFDHWVELAEGFVAIQVVTYLSQFFVRLRNLAWPMTICSCLLLFAATSYPFEPERLLLFLFLALIGAVLAGILYVIVQVNRDEAISRIAGTTPNRFTPDSGFFGSLVTYVLPAVGLVTMHFLGAFRFLIEPILRALQ